MDMFCSPSPSFRSRICVLLLLLSTASAVSAGASSAGVLEACGGKHGLCVLIGCGGEKSPGLAAELVFKPLGKEPPMSRRTLKFFTANTSFDIARARKLLGYEPRYGLEAGLRETYAVLKRDEPWRVPLPRAAGS